MSTVETSKPLLLYDGDCGFCTSSTRVLLRLFPSSFVARPCQEVDFSGLEPLRRRSEREVLWVGSGGEVAGGAQAFARILIHAGRPWSWLGGLLTVPPVRWLAAWGYTAGVEVSDAAVESDTCLAASAG